MNLKLHVDPYLLVCPTIGQKENDYISFIENLIDWECALRNKSIDVLVHHDVPTALFALNAFPIHNSIKHNNKVFNIDFISVDSISKIVNSFFNRLTEEFYFENTLVKTMPEHLKKGTLAEIDLILEQVYTYILLSADLPQPNALISPNFGSDTISVSCEINNGICDDFPDLRQLDKSGLIEVVSNYRLFNDKYIATELTETFVKANKKKIKLSGDHHGNNLLKNFAKKILKSKYVIEVINNIEYKPRSKNIFDKIHANGQIEVVLTETDEGFGMIIQTTGRDIKETEMIAQILKKEFGD